MLLKFFGDSINKKYIDQIIDTLKNDGVIIIPTDTVYAIAGSMQSSKAFERICRIKNVKPDKANFSLLCHDLSNISHFTKPFGTEIFRLMKSSLPGPFTFILNANNNVPSIFKSNKKTIGIRVPDNAIALAILEELGIPLVVSSVRTEEQIEDYLTDPDDIEEQFKDKVDIVVDGGPSRFEPSTIIDCTEDKPVLVRQGKGKIAQ